MTTPISIHGEAFSGSGFAGPTKIRVGPTDGPTNVTDIVVVNSTLITCTAPAKDPAWPYSVGIWITTPHGVGHRPNAFHYKEPVLLKVTKIAPTSGIFTGGTSVVITGVKFTLATKVYWDVAGDLLPATFVVDSDTQITALSPIGTPYAPYGIRVLTADEEYRFKCNDPVHFAWSYTPAPSVYVSGFIPERGSWLGGYTITVKGTGFLTLGLVDISYLALTSVGVITIVDDETATFVALSANAAFFGPYDYSGALPRGLCDIFYYQGASPQGPLYFQMEPLAFLSLNPESTPRTGGATIAITGTSLDTLTALAVYDDFNAISHDVFPSIVVTDPEHALFVMPAVAVDAVGRLIGTGQNPNGAGIESVSIAFPMT
jgi:hypothetical protein